MFLPALSQASPVANDDTASTLQNTPVIVNVIANDTGGTLTVIDYTNPANGSVVNNLNGTLTYTPNAAYLGADSFNYTITDGTGGLTHFWGLPGNAQDSVGTANGTLFNGPTTIAGHYGQALKFNKTNSYVQIPDFTYSNSFSITMWFKFDENAGTGYQYMYSHGTNATQNSVNISLGEASCGTFGDRNQLITVLQDSNDFFLANDLYVDVTSLIGDGQWHLYELTVQTGVGSSVYIDGVLKATSTHGGDAFNPATNLYLGARDDLAANRWSGGGLDSVSVYNRALSAAEASTLYTVGHLADTASATVNIWVGGTAQCPGWLVSTTLDGGVGSLRACIIAANALTGMTINVPAGTYTLTIPGQNENAAATGDLDIAANMTINGAGANLTIVDGGGLDRVFDVQKTVIATITGLTVRNGNPGVGDGGGILDGGTLTLTDVAVSGNSTTGNGGGIYNMKGTLTLNRVTISNNTAANGGGIGGESVTATTSMTNVTISGNTTVGSGGGFYDKKNFDTTMINVTIANNSAATSGGISATSAIMNLMNTIVANNTGGNCAGAITSSGNNLDSANTCGFGLVSDLRNTNPQLGPLQNNGGTLLTQALLMGSPAIDKGTNTGCPATDERGIARPFDGNGDSIATCDIGAFEYTGSASLSIIKQAWEVNGTTPLASPSSAAVGSTIVFLLYVKNTTGAAVNDLRINDILDETGFQYIVGSLVRTSAATPPADSATDKQIFDATAGGTGTSLTDGVDGDVASAIDTGGPPGPDHITIGAVVGQANGSLNISAHTTFALRFNVKVK